MTRKISALLATLALVAAIAVGCGGGGTSDSGMAPGQESNNPVTGGTQPGTSTPGTGDAAPGNGSSSGGN